MDGESGIMWQMVMLVMHVRDTFDRGSAVSCWQQLTRGEASWPEAAFPTGLFTAAAIFIQQKFLTTSTESDFSPDPAVKVGLEQMCRRAPSLVAEIQR